MFSIFYDLFNDLFNDSLLINKNFYHSLKENCDNKIKKENNNFCNCYTKNVEFNSKWVETEDSWFLYIMCPDAEITVDDKTIEVNYKKDNETKNSKFSEKGFLKLSFPKNSLPESIKAKKSDDGTYIKVSVNKAVVDEKPNRKRIVIE